MPDQMPGMTRSPDRPWAAADPPVHGSVSPPLPVTSWAVLGMLAFGEELTGNDAKKWADWSIGFYYWSPSVSQVYGELKKLESLGFATSRTVTERGVRARRVYRVSDAGASALSAWARDAPIEIPVLKHGVMLRLWLGHLSGPDHLRGLVRAHVDNMVDLRARAAAHAAHASREPGWAYPRMTLRWAVRYYDAEIALAEQLVDDIDEAARRFSDASVTRSGDPIPRVPGSWRSADDIVSALASESGDDMT